MKMVLEFRDIEQDFFKICKVKKILHGSEL